MNLFARFEALLAYWRARGLARRLRTRDDVARWQSRRLSRWRPFIARTRFYAPLTGTPFEQLPIVDKGTLMERFEDFNQPRITAAAGWAAFAGSGRVGGNFVGASTGTSGNRGLYVISETERWRWLGTMLAKTMPRLRRARVALVLPLNSSLYDAAGSSLLQFRFFDLHTGIDTCGAGIAAWNPDTLIAPPKVLRWLAESGLQLGRVKHVFSAAEVLDPLDRAIIEARFGVTVREIYMATEGLMGVACEHGTLHLCEDTMLFEFERPVPGGLVAPIITDFSRTTQVMARYRMNDLLRLADAPCACGSPLQALASVEGRMDDVLWFETANGRVMVTPDILRNAVVDADRRIADFRIVQHDATTLHLTLHDELPSVAVTAARSALATCLATLGCTPSIEVVRVAVFEVTARKQRRVERRWQP